MSYSFLAGLEYGAKVAAAPIDPDTLIVLDSGGATTMGGNSYDENGEPRMREYGYRYGEVRTGPGNRTVIGVEADAPPEGFRWVLYRGRPFLWDADRKPTADCQEIEWLKIDGVRIR